jgi:hypothetical protein
MQMDISKWIQFNPKLTVEHTTKKYFGKYLYKIVVYCPAGRLVDSKDPMDQALEHRRSITKHINQSGWWGARHHRDLDNADVEFLDVLRNIRQDRTLGIKLRVEEPRVQIYANTESELLHLAETQLKSYGNKIESIAGPANDDCANILNTGAIIRKKDLGFKYKVILRDGRYSPEIKSALLSYLGNLEAGLIKVPMSGVEMLQKSTGFIWNLYLYTNDPSITTFLELISPGIVLNCHELVVLE